MSTLSARVGAASWTWTCSSCRNQLVRARPFRYNGHRQFGSASKSSIPPRSGARAPNGRRVVLYASSGSAVAGASMLAFSDDIKTGYDTVERTGRVVAGLGICINEYGSSISFVGCAGQALIWQQLPNDAEREGEEQRRGRTEENAEGVS